MRTILLVVALVGCTASPPAATAKPDPNGTCYDGKLVGGEAIPCAGGSACALVADKPACLAAKDVEQKEPCGNVQCGVGCACSGDTPNECVCMQLGPKTQ